MGKDRKDEENKSAIQEPAITDRGDQTNQDVAFSGFNENDRAQAAQSNDKRNEAILEAGEENCVK